MTVESMPDTREKLASVQILRGFAAVSVVLCHVVWAARYNGNVAVSLTQHVLERLGDFGVDAFFCISGFVITLSRQRAAGRVADAASFLAARIRRIYPTYIFWVLAQLVALRLGIAIGLTALSGLYPWPGLRWLARNLLLLPGREPFFLMQAWTLLYEMYFYLAFTAVLLVHGRRRNVWAVIGVIGAVFVLFHFGLGQGERQGYASLRWMLGDPLVWNFVAGALLAEAFRRWPRRVTGPRALGLFAAAGLLAIIALALPEALPRLVRLGLPAAGILGLLMCAEPPRGWPAALAIYVGEASYSIYITHGVLAVLAPLIAAALPLDTALTGLALSALAIAAGCGAYELVEKRMFGRGREGRALFALVGGLAGMVRTRLRRW